MTNCSSSLVSEPITDSFWGRADDADSPDWEKDVDTIDNMNVVEKVERMESPSAASTGMRRGKGRKGAAP